MADNGNGNDEHQARSPSPDSGQHINDQQPSGNPFPPQGFQGFYGYAPQDGSQGDGSGAQNAGIPQFFFPGAHGLYQAFTSGANGMPPAGLFPMMGQMPNNTSFMVRPKRRQVKNACINCASACKRCDNQRPCERCKKYGIVDTCTDSLRKERKKGVKRGPYKRRLKNGQLSPVDGDEHPDAEWLPNEPPPDTVDPADLPTGAASQTQNNNAANQPFPTPDGYYTYPYPYPMPPPGEGQPSEGGPFPPPPPHFFPHLHPAAYPPYPPWQPPFGQGEIAPGQTQHDGGAGSDDMSPHPPTNNSTGSARTSGAKKKRAGNAQAKKSNDEVKAAASVKRDTTAAMRAARAARRRGAESRGAGNGHSEPPTSDSVIDMSGVTDPSLLGDEHSHNSNAEVMTMDPQAATA